MKSIVPFNDNYDDVNVMFVAGVVLTYLGLCCRVPGYEMHVGIKGTDVFIHK